MCETTPQSAVPTAPLYGSLFSPPEEWWHAVTEWWHYYTHAIIGRPTYPLSQLCRLLPSMGAFFLSLRSGGNTQNQIYTKLI